MTKKVIRINEATIRFAGDSGDGMQLTGTRFTEATAIVGNDLKKRIRQRHRRKTDDTFAFRGFLILSGSFIGILRGCLAGIVVILLAATGHHSQCHQHGSHRNKTKHN